LLELVFGALSHEHVLRDSFFVGTSLLARFGPPMKFDGFLEY
jgi:hypothetical protein